MYTYIIEYTAPTIIPKLGEIIRDELPVDKTELMKHVRVLLSHRYELAIQETAWLMKLHESRTKVLWPKDNSKTELDRKTYMDAAVAQIRADYEMLVQLEDIVKERLNWALSLLEH